MLSISIFLPIFYYLIIRYDESLKNSSAFSCGWFLSANLVTLTTLTKHEHDVKHLKYRSMHQHKCRLKNFIKRSYYNPFTII